MKKLYLLLGLLFTLSLGACSLGGSSTSDTTSDTTNDTTSDTSSDTSGDITDDHVHTWDEATYSWNGLDCTAEAACTVSGCDETLTETVTASYVKDTDATCYYNESGHFEASFENEMFVDQVTEENSAEQEDTMLAHTLTEVTYTWEGDECTASTACTVEACGATIEETVKANLVEDTAGDCYNNAKGHYEAVFESAYLTTQTTEVNGIEIPDTKKHETEMYLDEDRRQYVTACTLCKEEFIVEDCYATYAEGEALNGGLNYVLPTPILMSDLSGKALRFEFKFTSETGSFAFSLSGNDWLHITNIVTITKTENSFIVTDSGNNMACGRIVEAGNGWYAWEINAAAFPNSVAATAQSIEKIIPRNTVVGTVYIDWNSLAIVDAYTSRDVPTVYTTGDELGRTNFSPILLSQMEGKAIRFEFKFLSETGSFSFQVMGLDWDRISDIVTVTKTANGISANFGRIVDAGDGWYAWELNKSGFTGDAMSKPETDTIDFIYPRDKVVGDLYVDWQSVSVVDEYEVDARLEESTKYQTGEKLNGGANYVLPTPMLMSALKGKALRFEFKFESETGSFAFSLMEYAPWLRLTNTVTITKTASGFTATDDGTNKACGRIVDAGDGWYAWEINAADFPGSGAATAQMIDIIVPRNTVDGTLYLNWNSFAIVDAYGAETGEGDGSEDEEETDPRFETATKYENGATLNGGANYLLSTPISVSELSGKALRWEFKFASETGSFAFSLVQYTPWVAFTNVVTITKTASGFTVTDSDGNKPCGRVVDAGNGWYAWEINAADFPCSSAGTAQVLDLIRPRNTVVGTLYLDLNSMKIVDAYDSGINNATKVEAGAAQTKVYFKDNASIAITDLFGKAIQVVFQPADDSEGELFRFSLHSNAWDNMTGTVVISRSGNTITANQGIIIDAGNGRYSWQLCHALFMGDGSNKPGATEVAFLYTGTITHAVYIYGEDVKAVDAYDKTAQATQFVQGDELKNVVAKRAINKSDWNNTWSGFTLYLEFKFENEADGELFRFAVAANSWANLTATVVISKNGDTVTANRGQVIALEDGWYAWTVSADAFEGNGAAEATDIAFVMAAGQPIAASKVWILPYLKAVQLS